MSIHGQIVHIKHNPGQLCLRIENTQGAIQEVTLNTNIYYPCRTGDLIGVVLDEKDKDAIPWLTVPQKIGDWIFMMVCFPKMPGRDAAKFFYGVKRIFELDTNAELYNFISSRSQIFNYYDFEHPEIHLSPYEIHTIMHTWNKHNLERNIKLLGLKQDIIRNLEDLGYSHLEIRKICTTNPLSLLPLEYSHALRLAKTYGVKYNKQEIIMAKLLREKFAVSHERKILHTDIGGIDFDCADRFGLKYANKRILLNYHSKAIETFWDLIHKIKNNSIIKYNPELEKIAFLDKQQQKTVWLAGQQSFLCITGGAGVGKTTVLLKIFEMFHYDQDTYILSFTGKVISKIKNTLNSVELEKQIMTIHRFLVEYDKLNRDITIIIDEASMLDIMLLNRLLVRISCKNARLILIGDPRQLQPLSYGKPFIQLLNKLGDKYIVTLKNDYRRLKENKINVVLDSILSFNLPTSNEDFNIMYSKNNFFNYINKFSFKQILQMTMLCPYNTETNNINTYLDNKFCKSPVVDRNRGKFYVGQKVMVTKNFTKQNYFNGETYIITKIHTSNKAKTLEFDDNPELNIPLDFGNIGDDYISSKHLVSAWCITIHKSQGSEFDNVLVYIPKSTRFINNEMIYTALSRAKKKLLLFLGFTSNEFLKCVKRRENKK